jgi:hypothetical protein
LSGFRRIENWFLSQHPLLAFYEYSESAGQVRNSFLVDRYDELLPQLQEVDAVVP